MAKFTPPKPGTEISVKWNKFGPMVKVNGNVKDLMLTLAIINGELARKCEIQIPTLMDTAEHGPEVFDMNELARQAKEESHEDP